MDLPPFFSGAFVYERGFLPLHLLRQPVMFCLGQMGGCPLKAGPHNCKAAAIKAVSPDKKNRKKKELKKKIQNKKPQWARSVNNAQSRFIVLNHTPIIVRVIFSSIFLPRLLNIGWSRRITVTLPAHLNGFLVHFYAERRRVISLTALPDCSRISCSMLCALLLQLAPSPASIC